MHRQGTEVCMFSSTLFYSTLFSCSFASELVLYWGQASAGQQQSLGEYCKQTAGDIYVISFINSFNSKSLSLNVAGACSEQLGSSGLLHCPSIGEDIKSCQAAGKKVFISLGGAAGTYGFGGDDEGKLCATNVWNTFGGGQSDERPFDDAVVDGFDLDIENGNDNGYTGFVEELRNHFAGASKQFYISAAPQCPYPDASIGKALAGAHFDHVYIQFYNNYCSLAGDHFNWDTWQDYAANTSPNKDVKLFVGLPGAQSAAGSGYLGPDEVKAKLSAAQSSSNFGGIMLWDASQAFTNVVNGVSFANSMHSILGGHSSPVVPVSSSAPVSSASPSGPATPASSRTTSPIVSSSQNVKNLNFDGSVSVVTTNTVASATPVSSESDVTTTVTRDTTVVLGHSTKIITNADPSSSTTAPSVAPAPATSESAPAPASAIPAPKILSGGTCTDGQTRCNGPKYSVCDHGSWVDFDCAQGTVCNVNDEGNAYCVWPKREHHIHAPKVLPVITLGDF